MQVALAKAKDVAQVPGLPLTWCKIQEAFAIPNLEDGQQAVDIVAMAVREGGIRRGQSAQRARLTEGNKELGPKQLIDFPGTRACNEQATGIDITVEAEALRAAL